MARVALTDDNGALYGAPGDWVGNRVATESLEKSNYIAKMSRSHANARMAWEDSSLYVENWNDLSAWNRDTPDGMQVSGGRVYAAGTDGNKSVMTYDADAGTTGRIRALIPLRMVAGSGSSLIVGFHNRALGTVPNGNQNVRGLRFAPDGTVKAWDGTDVAQLGSWAAGDYTVTLVGDEQGFSVTATGADGAREYKHVWSRTGYSLRGLMIFNSDSRQLSGNSFGKIGVRRSLATIPPAAGVEGLTPRTVQHTLPNGTHRARIALPGNYDARRPSPLVIFSHGSGGNENTPQEHLAPASYAKVASALNAAGCIVASTHGTPADEWGNQSMIDSIRSMYLHIRDRYSVGPVIMWGGSMGGLATLNSVADGRIPGVVGVMLNQPVASLQAAYNGTFAAGIRSAYGIAADGSDYASKTAGYDPMLKSATAFRGLPFWISRSYEDTMVPPSQHADPFVAKIDPASDVTLFTSTGEHSDATTFQPTAQRDWVLSLL